MRSLFAAAVAVTLAGAVAAADKGTEVELAGMKSTTPAGWKEEAPSNKMRLTQFRLPKAEGDDEDAELALFVFPGGSGSVDANLKRQVAKFRPAEGKDKVEEKVEKTKVGGVEATYQDVSGTYFKTAGPFVKEGVSKTGFRQLYVIFETADGKQYYMNLIGPAKTVEKHKKAFDEWLKNFK